MAIVDTRTPRTRGKGKCDVDGVRVECESWSDFLALVATPRPDGHHYTESDSRHDARWSGSTSLDDAVKLATDGWVEGERLIQSLTHRLEARLLHRIVREDVNYDVEGMTFDVARYLTGEPEHWIRNEESDMSENAHKHVRVVYNICASSGIGTDVIQARGAACAALVELLEYAGHRVELWVVAAVDEFSSSKPPLIDTRIKVKAYDQHMEPARLAFAMAHPSMLRRLFFRAWETLPLEVQAKMGGSYGMPAETPIDDESIYVGSAMWGNEQWATPAAAEAWIIAKLAAQGVVLHDA